MEYKEQYKYLTNICLNLTDACNLACRYCFVEQHPHFMTYDIAKDAVDWLINNLHIKKQNNWCSEDEQVFITYFGGEPTLLWDEIIVPLTIYAKEKYKDEIHFGITTNGTLLNKERVNFLKQYNVFPLLSIDGAEETQNYNRPCHDGNNSFDKVIKNIPYLLEAFPNITFRSTIIPDTVNNMFKNYLFAEFLGFKNYFAVPNARENWSEEAIEILKQQLKLIFGYRLLQYQNNNYVMNWSIIDDTFERILQKDIKTFNKVFDKPYLSRNPNRCGLGTVMGAIAYDGSIYGCQEQPSRDNKNIFLIGNIYNGGINQERHESLLKEYTQLKYCKCSKEDFCEQCYFKSICENFACPSSSWDIFKDFLITPYIDCLWFNFLYENAVIMMNILVKENNLYFKNYLDNNCKYKNYFKEEEEI